MTMLSSTRYTPVPRDSIGQHSVYTRSYVILVEGYSSRQGDLELRISKRLFLFFFHDPAVDWPATKPPTPHSNLFLALARSLSSPLLTPFQ